MTKQPTLLPGLQHKIGDTVTVKGHSGKIVNLEYQETGSRAQVEFSYNGDTVTTWHPVADLQSPADPPVPDTTAPAAAPTDTADSGNSPASDTTTVTDAGTQVKNLSGGNDDNAVGAQRAVPSEPAHKETNNATLQATIDILHVHQQKLESQLAESRRAIAQLRRMLQTRPAPPPRPAIKSIEVRRLIRRIFVPSDVLEDDDELAALFHDGWQIIPELTSTHIDHAADGNVNFVNEIIYLRRYTRALDPAIAAIETTLSTPAHPSQSFMSNSPAPATASASSPTPIFDLIQHHGWTADDIISACNEQSIDTLEQSLARRSACRSTSSAPVLFIPEVTPQ